MRIRARHIHALEALLDNFVGLAINFFLIFLVYNWWLGHEISVSDNLLGSIVFFIVAWIRKYTLRRWSSNLIGRIYARRKAQEDAELQEQA
jgi:hypothetical protein